MEPQAQVLINNFGTIAVITQSVGVLMGVFLIVTGIFKLKRYGEMRTFMSQQMTMMGPMMYLIAGSAMLCLPTMLSLMESLFWGAVNPLSGGGDAGDLGQYVVAVHVFIRLVGAIAIIRGVMMLSKCGTQGQPGKGGKAGMHIFGGIMCIHIVGTIDLFLQIFDLPW